MRVALLTCVVTLCACDEGFTVGNATSSSSAAATGGAGGAGAGGSAGGGEGGHGGALGAGACAGQPMQSEVDVDVQNDTYLDQNSPRQGNDAQGVLAVSGVDRNQKVTLLRFHTGTTSGLARCCPTAARVAVHVFEHEGDGPLSLSAFEVTMDWDSDATWSSDGITPNDWEGCSNKPCLGDQQASASVGEAQVDTRVSFDVSPGLVQAWIDDPSRDGGLRISSETPPGQVELTSADNGAANDHPQLVVECVPR